MTNIDFLLDVNDETVHDQAHQQRSDPAECVRHAQARHVALGSAAGGSSRGLGSPVYGTVRAPLEGRDI